MLARALADTGPSTVFLGEPQLAEELQGKLGGLEPGPERQLLEQRLALSWLRTGDTERALDLYGRQLAVPGGADPGVQRNAAIAQMRLAEQRNCIERHTCDSCVFPILEGGRHVAAGAARAAAEGWAAQLARDPDDLMAKWLHNVSSQAAGLPVLDELRMELPRDDRVADLAPLIDRAQELGVAVAEVSGGCVMDDLDGDGDLDLLASSIYPGPGGVGQLRLFENRGPELGFVESTEVSGLEGIKGGLNLMQGDYDNDGDLDVFVLRGAWRQGDGRWPNTLLQNQGNGRFRDVTVSAGVLAFEPTQTAVWSDFDGDGWLDLFVGNETSLPVLLEDPISQWFAERLVGLGDLFDATPPARLYRNLGDGRFEDVLSESGIDVKGWIKGVTAGDYDGDGRSDLYLSRYARPNLLFRNLGGFEFEEVAEAAGVDSPTVSFATWFWDYDNDGHLDLMGLGFPYPEFEFPDEGPLELRFDAEPEVRELVGGVRSPGNRGRSRLFRNLGDGRFEDVTRAVGLDPVMSVMGANFGDVDGDGRLDMLLGTGAPQMEYLVPNRLFVQREGVFVDATEPLRAGHLQKGHGVAFGDWDGDGDQDIYAVMGGAHLGDVYPNILLENPGYGSRWITLVLEGAAANRAAIGARVCLQVLRPDGSVRAIHRTVCSGGSFGSSSLQLEIGVGDAVSVKSLEIRWPDRANTPQRVHGHLLALGSRYRIRQGCTPRPVGAAAGPEEGGLASKGLHAGPPDLR